ncbi:MAG TPA: hypothetical protein VJL56_02365 [Candidatus Bathyarchaeia archaeon]|nr:hypothetical protein [Candidatus Bathyarchaeia archaeon]
MFTTAEVRWFFEGPLPEEVKQWFCRSSLALNPAPREDHYLLFPAALGLGLKLREGRLEIKPLVESLGVRTFTADVAGTVQVWKKEAYGEPAFKEFERLRTSTPHLWITVRKKRTLRKFSLESATLVEVPADRVFLRDGCNVEVTEITVEGSAYWSFNFEAYGNPARVEDYLQRVAAHVLKDNRRPHYTFSSANSCSYPEWLGRVVKKE